PSRRSAAAGDHLGIPTDRLLAADGERRVHRVRRQRRRRRHTGPCRVGAQGGPERDSRGRRVTGMLIVADDLSGAAETAGAVTAVTSGVADLRFGIPEDAHAADTVRVLDTDSRAMEPRPAGETTVRALRGAHP